jgi:hypothetical protein
LILYPKKHETVIVTKRGFIIANNIKSFFENNFIKRKFLFIKLILYLIQTLDLVLATIDICLNFYLNLKLNHQPKHINLTITRLRIITTRIIITRTIIRTITRTRIYLLISRLKIYYILL